MKHLLLLTLLALCLPSCAASPYSEYRKWASEPTPDIWKLHSDWSFILLDEQGDIVRTLIVRFTDRAADTCISGEWRKVDLFSEHPKRQPLSPGDKIEAAYQLEGSYLELELRPNLCDNYYPLKGRLTNFGVSGTHGHDGMFGGEIVGRFYGVPIRH